MGSGEEVDVATTSTRAREAAPSARLRTARLGIAQIAPRLGDLAANVEMHLETIAAARAQKADLVVFPELSTAGYQLKDLVPDVALDARSPHFRELLAASRGLAVGFGFVEESSDHRFYNSYAYCEDGRLVHVHRKVYLPTYGLFEEGRLYAAGEHVRAFDSRQGRLGLLVCEDVWHPSAMYVLSLDGADLVVAASASPLRGADTNGEASNVGVWHNAIQMYAQLFGCFMVLVNRVGFEDGLSFWGGSRVVAPGGRVAFEAPLLEPGLSTCEIDRNEVRRHRVGDPTLRSERLDITLAELQRIQRERQERGAGPQGLAGWEESP
jgi:predicted amidohydrolase